MTREGKRKKQIGLKKEPSFGILLGSQKDACGEGTCSVVEATEVGTFLQEEDWSLQLCSRADPASDSGRENVVNHLHLCTLPFLGVMMLYPSRISL